MTDRPILFSGPMVRAILEGRKTQTRRVINPQPISDSSWVGGWVIHTKKESLSIRDVNDICPYCIGESRWVRETYRETGGSGGPSHGYKFWGEYRADGKHFMYDCPEMRYGGDVGKRGSVNWRPAIFMPRLACRITLEIIGVRVQRVQEISEEDAKAEGVQMPDRIPEPPEWWSYRQEFCYLWNSINAKRGFGWDRNPWVWAISFKRVR